MSRLVRHLHLAIGAGFCVVQHFDRRGGELWSVCTTNGLAAIRKQGTDRIGLVYRPRHHPIGGYIEQPILR